MLGASLGVAACAGWMSRALGVPVPTDVVATAQVSPTGQLEPVQHLAAKLIALRRSLPQAQRVVVAADQSAPDDMYGLELVRCKELATALDVFGLSPARLPEDFSVQHYERDAEGLRHLENTTLGAEEWIEHARHAQEIACALASFGDSELLETAARARIQGALFALHGGDPAFAEALLTQVGGRNLPHELTAFSAVVRASASIDRAPGIAVDQARSALALAEELRSTYERRGVLGRAYGTLGRALMHADHFEEALPWLEKGAAFHRDHAPREHARSLCYLAQCLRGLDRPADALETTRAALAWATTHAATSASSKAYLWLEEGRALLILGRPSEALDAFECVIDGQANDWDHPRISGLRGKAAALRALGQAAAAEEWFDRCTAVAQTCTQPLLREVAALAIGDLLVYDATAVSPVIRDLWANCFPSFAEAERVRWRARTYVY